MMNRGGLNKYFSCYAYVFPREVANVDLETRFSKLAAHWARIHLAHAVLQSCPVLHSCDDGTALSLSGSSFLFPAVSLKPVGVSERSGRHSAVSDVH